MDSDSHESADLSYSTARSERENKSDQPEAPVDLEALARAVELDPVNPVHRQTLADVALFTCAGCIESARMSRSSSDWQCVPATGQRYGQLA